MGKKHINKTEKKKKVKKKKDNKKVINKKKEVKRDLIKIITKRYLFYIILIILLFAIIASRLVQLTIIDNKEYSDKLVSATQKTVTSSSAPRGRIYDRNYNLLVDNKAVKTIYYVKQKGVTTKEELEIAKTLADNIDIDYSKLAIYDLKNYWYLNHKEEANNKITKEEWRKNEERKLSDSDIKKLIFERITDEDLSIYTEEDKKISYIYYLMNKGYSYAEKIIKNENVTEEEYAYVSENIDTLNGVNTKLDWERVYLYGDTFKSILGSVSSDKQGIPEELAEDYLEKGYSMNDRVGISYLEYQYEDYLKGEKSVYKVGTDNSYELIEEGKRGNDIVLTIDIELQQYVEEVLSNEVLSAKGDTNTEYYNRSFVIVSHPSTGEVLAMAGKQLKDTENGYTVVDYTPGTVTLPVTPGSVVKGASILVGYKYGAIDIGTSMQDECIKIKSTPEKCSWKQLGYINDITAIAQSSNSYQYKIAIKVGGATYEYNQGLSIDESAFDKYRDMYASFGLGVKSGIDLPVESLGYIGKSKLPGYLLDFSIGQYDTYTPIQLSSYINTLANSGTRVKPYLLKEVYGQSYKEDEKFGELIYKAETDVLGKVDVEDKYIKRVREAFNVTTTSGLGRGYTGNYTDSGGKTGTSQSFIDTDSDGVVDTETITTSFVGYVPAENPEMSIVVVSPDISHESSYSYTNSVTKNISSQVVNKYFEMKNE